MSIYLWEGKTTVLSDMQWPAPDGFHVPLSTEWQAIYDAGVSLGAWSSEGSVNLSTYLKMPVAAGYREYSSRVYGVGSFGRYWSSSPTSLYYTAYCLNFNYSSISPQSTDNRNQWFSIRCMKNTPITPTDSWTKLYWTSIESWWIFWNSTDWLISISSNGSTWYTLMDKNLWATTVYNYWDTLTDANCGYFYQWGNNYWFPHSWSVTTSSTTVDASTYWPWNYYESSTWITYNPWDYSSNNNIRWWTSQWSSTIVDTWIKSVYLWSTKAKAVYVWTTKVYPEPREKLRPNVDTIISTANWTIKHWYDSNYWEIELKKSNWDYIIIADRNVWANAVNEWWTTFQRWNNYWFPTTWNVSVTTTLVNASNYWPSTVNWYYSSSTFVYWQNYPYDWQTSPANKDLWWWITWTQAAMRWPCPEWYHIPTYDELVYFNTILDVFASSRDKYGSYYGNDIISALFITYPWWRQVNWEMSASWTNEIRRSSIHNWDRDIKSYNFAKISNNYHQITNSTRDWFRSASIRPFKNT